MAETGLGLEEVAVADEVGGHAMAEPVEAGYIDTGGIAQSGEAMTERRRGEAGFRGARLWPPA